MYSGILVGAIYERDPLVSRHGHLNSFCRPNTGRSSVCRNDLDEDGNLFISVPLFYLRARYHSFRQNQFCPDVVDDAKQD